MTGEQTTVIEESTQRITGEREEQLQAETPEMVPIQEVVEVLNEAMVVVETAMQNVEDVMVEENVVV